MFFIFDMNDTSGSYIGPAIINMEQISSITEDYINNFNFLVIKLIDGQRYYKAFYSNDEKVKYFDYLIKTLHAFELEQYPC